MNDQDVLHVGSGREGVCLFACAIKQVVRVDSTGIATGQRSVRALATHIHIAETSITEWRECKVTEAISVNDRNNGLRVSAVTD
jgi:hypothetical protein